MAPEQSAAAACAAVPELIEQVLLQLTLRDILAAQRVSRSWQTIIAASPSLQKALFFRPIEYLPLQLAEHRNAFYWKCNTSAECRASESGVEDDLSNGCITRWAKDPTDEREYRIIVNPILVVGRNPWYQPYFHEGAIMTTDKKISEFECYRRPEASWRKMLLTQPPLTHVLVDHAVRLHWHLVEARRETTGLTLGDLYDSATPFHGTVRSIWGDDEVGLGVRSSSTAAEVLVAIRGLPAGQNSAVLDDDPDFNEPELNGICSSRMQLITDVHTTRRKCQ